MEDLQVMADGTVRNNIGGIYDLAYGGLGLDPAATVHNGGENKFCDVERLMNKLNIAHESKTK